MKKIILFSLALCLLILPTQAQLKLGIKAGANITGFSGYTSEAIINDVKNATHFNAGLALQVGLGNILAIQPELLISTKGAILSNDQANTTLNMVSTLTGKEIPNSLTLNTAYIELPIYIQAGIRLGNLLRGYVQAGPYFSYLVSDKMVGDDDFYSSYKKFLADMSGEEPLSKLDYGVGVGAGIEVLSFQLAIKYDFGLAEFKKITSQIGQVDYNILSEFKNRNLSISLAYFF